MEINQTKITKKKLKALHWQLQNCKDFFLKKKFKLDLHYLGLKSNIELFEPDKIIWLKFSNHLVCLEEIESRVQQKRQPLVSG